MMRDGAVPTSPPENRRVSDPVLARDAGRLEPVGEPLLERRRTDGLSKDPVDCLLARHATMASCTTTWPRSALAPYDAMSRRAKQMGVGFLSTRGFVCFEQECPTVIGHTIAWMDNSHLTVAYSAQISDAFRAVFVDAVRKLGR
jgi:hypothetical protein